ncbi:glycoside hydrolase family 2 protein [Flavivirga rizhaonensis]|uniref:Glycoside hydrolase family 2 protein n=1 Tax=Flavivirga rizhaonensis TaxID=2559571 RepID=A0A4S1DZX9_9FLAO|nr:DUF4982 domain-containing protein [Flavivirga rizhaonensis]TGV03152.1 glycoside hydrolase family 2 protein [Flavivirga rizhaonensis]
MSLLPKKTLSSIAFLLLINFLFVRCQNTNSDTPNKTTNLGETPWKYHKVDSLNIKNFTSDLNIDLKKEDEEGYKVHFNLKEEMSESNLKVSFTNNKIVQIFYLLEGQKTDGSWEVISDHLINSKIATPKSFATVDETGDTVGLINKQKGVYFNTKIGNNFQAIRISHLVTKNRWANKIIIEEPQIELLKTTSTTKNFATADFDDSNWQSVGIPHCFNDNDTYLNSTDSYMWRGEVWYRKHLFLSEAQKDKNFILEFQGVNVGAAIYVNGQFIKGNTAVKQTDEVTHVGGFLPFALNITSKLVFGAENIIAVRVSNETDGFFTNPGFGIYEGFGMGWGGIVSPVFLHEVNPVHIPVNASAPGHNWGNYIATTNVSSESADIRIITNVENNSSINESITLVTELYNSKNELVKEDSAEKDILANNTAVFDFKQTITNPTLWFPNNSPHGTPYLYTLQTKIYKGKNLIDKREDKVGIRTITWDENYCYVNNKKHFMQGFGHRNIYPALGSAIPDELQWKDIQLIAASGGNTLRVGHVPATKTMVDACDVYGIMIFQNSGDNEWVLKGEPAKTYKAEYDQEMITAFRNHPSIAVWESNNGLPKKGDVYHAYNTYKIAQKLDSLNSRIIHNRDGYPSNWPDSLRVMVGYTNRYRKIEGSPTLNTEVYGANWGGISWNIARHDFENEVTFTDYFVNNYLRDKNDRACGWIDWMLAETQGEGYTTYLNGMSKQKSLGSSAMDGNRIPKLKYNVYKKALWIPFETQPGVALQTSWNLSGIQTVSAWSNCNEVELFLNGQSLDKRHPEKDSKKCTWENIKWAAGTLKAVGLDANGKEVCSDIRTTAGKPHRIELIVEPNLTKPNGGTFTIKANGTDTAIITARILDQNENLCVNSTNNIQFSVEGSATYRGSYNFYVTPEKLLHYHTPGDLELQAEGGLIRVAIKSNFEADTIKVKAQSEGLKGTEVIYEIHPIND